MPLKFWIRPPHQRAGMILVWKKQFQDIRISAQVKAVWFSLIPKLSAPADFRMN
jgi:hypothetical protein